MAGTDEFIFLGFGTMTGPGKIDMKECGTGGLFKGDKVSVFKFDWQSISEEELSRFYKKYFEDGEPMELERVEPDYTGGVFILQRVPHAKT